MGTLDHVADLFGVKRVRDYLEHPDPKAGESLEIKGYMQTHSYTCGAIAGWMVVESIWPRRSFERFFRLVSPDSVTGTSTTKLIKALRQSSIGVSRRAPTFANIKKAIRSGFPIIASIDRPGMDYDHWIVIYGYSLHPSRIYVAGNRFGRLVSPGVLDYAEFNSLCNEKLMVCYGVLRS